MREWTTRNLSSRKRSLHQQIPQEEHGLPLAARFMLCPMSKSLMQVSPLFTAVITTTTPKQRNSMAEKHPEAGSGGFGWICPWRTVLVWILMSTGG